MKIAGKNGEKESRSQGAAFYVWYAFLNVTVIYVLPFHEHGFRKQPSFARQLASAELLE